MKFQQITQNKRRFLPLLLLADEQEDMIDRYLDRGEMFALYDDNLKGVAVVTEEGPGLCELKNLAIAPVFQRKGYGKAMVEFLLHHYRGKYQVMQVGTGESPSTLCFYEACGFTPSHRVDDFFTQNYQRPIYDGDIQLKDMVYLKKEL